MPAAGAAAWGAGLGLGLGAGRGFGFAGLGCAGPLAGGAAVSGSCAMAPVA